MACVLLGIGRFFRDRGRVFIAMASLLFFSATGAFAAAVVLPCEYRVEVDADGNYRFDQARVGRTADGANRRVWAQFNLSALPAGGLVSNAGFRVFNDWSGANISSLRYTAIRPSAGPSALAAQHTFANRYAGFSWSIDTDDAWTPGEGDFFRPDWSAWPRGNGNTLVQDVQAHLDDGKTWFAVQFDCFACDPVANLRLPPPDESFSWSIVMELEIADAVALVPEKNFGPCVSCPDCPSAGNPINFATGNKYETEIDLDLSGPGLPLRFVRYYNSQREQDGFFGYGWTGSFSEALAVETGKIILREADGREVHFPDDGAGTFVSEADRVRTINPETGGYLLAEPDGKTLSFDTAGKLLRIADRNGNTQTVTYDMNDRIASVADNFGRQLTFTPDIDGRLAILTTPVGDFDYTYADGNLTAVTKPDATTRQYRYEDANDPHNLTGIVNENQVLYARFTYDDQDRATGSEYIGGSHGASITYNSDLTRRVTDGRGNATDFTLDARHGMGRVASSTGSGCATCPAASGGSFTSNARFLTETFADDRGHTTRYTYDDRGNILAMTEAEGTADERTTAFAWHPDFALPAAVTRPSVSGATVTDTYAYDPNGNLQTLTEAGGAADVRTTAFTWDGLGRMTSIDGPRTDATDTTTFTYYPAVDGGYLHTVTNAENQTTTFSSYNGFGKPEQVTDANGVVTTFGYDGMGRMTSKTTAGLATGYTYDNAGRLTRITLPGTREIIYAYTDANLPESITDNGGNAIHYLYDAEGNRTREEVRDAGGVLQKYVDYEHDAFNRLWKVLYPGDGGPYEEYLYDGNDNLTNFRNANGHVTEYLYDALDRLESEIRPGAVTTGLDHDAADNPTRVTDPGANTTVYTHDDLGRTVQVESPDAGITAYARDPAGNIVSRTDANGATATYGYDALNRLTSVSFPDSSRNLSYGYDAGTYGKGRLTSATDPAGSTGFVHDALGRVTTESRVTDGVPYQTDYAYDPSTGDLSGMTYPSGLTLDFQYDANGRVSGISSGGQTLVGNAAYKPFGPVKSMDLGPLALTRTYDQRYQITGIQAGTVLNYAYTHDGAGNVETISGIAKPELTPRQTDATYTGNRLISIDTLWAVPPDYPAASATYTHDDAGNTTSDGLRFFDYSPNHRLARVRAYGAPIAEYAYDGFERRTKKFVDGVTTHFHYDLNGLLISETDGNGNPRRDYVYLNGEPVAMKVYGGSAGWYWFVNDHLGTPQKMVDESGNVVWAAAYAPFGEARVYVDEVTNNLRFPGQYYDVETGLHYNWHRYYDPGTGRYLRPDPIGLAGGTNLYTYVRNNPPNSIDPLGLIDLVDDVLFDPDDPLSVPGPFVGGGGGGGFRGFGSGRFKNIFSSQPNSIRGCSSKGRGIQAPKKLPRYQGPKPKYHVNPQHLPGRGLKAGKTPLPKDAESVFKNAVPNDPKNPTAWFGKNADGQIYRFSAGNDGTAHFSGIHGVGDGTRNLTDYAMQRLGGL